MGNKQCPHCGYSNPPAATFCGECGRPLLAGHPCPNCGFTGGLPEAVFCVQCGASLRKRSRPSFAWVGGLALLLLLVAAVVVWQTGLFEEWTAGPSVPSASRSATATAAFIAEEAVAATMSALAALPPTDMSTPSFTPTQPPTAIPPSTVTRPSTATPSPTVPPSPAYTPSPTPCPVAVYGAFSEVWLAHASQLGCPSSASKTDVWMAQEDFQQGRMFWRKDNNKIYALYHNGRWERYDDLWREGDPAFTCGTQQNPPTPIRGFGEVWCTYTAVQQGLGDATGIEWGEYGAVQDFDNGLILQTGSGEVYVFYSDGTWR